MNAEPNFRSIRPIFAQGAGVEVFSADDGLNGRELWVVSVGPPAIPPVGVADIYTVPESGALIARDANGLTTG